jgi:N-acetylglucosamine kinase-like BadF-type ATPase
MTSPLFFGLDGGNTKTVGVVSDAHGNVLAQATGGCGDYYNAGDRALSTLHEVTAAALARAGISFAEVAGAAFCLAGADWPEDFKTLEDHVAKFGLGGPTRVFNDAHGALRGCSLKGEGLALVCGTFGTVAARSPSGNTWFAGPWCTVGASTEMGRRGLYAVIHNHIGVGPPTAITEQLKRDMNLPDVESVVHRFTSCQENGTRPHGEIAPSVLTAAAHNDTVAIAIVELGAQEQIRLARAAALATKLESPFPLFLSGGMFRERGNAWEKCLCRLAQEEFPHSTIAPSRLPPVGGAVLLGFELADQPVSMAVLENLARTLSSSR